MLRQQKLVPKITYKEMKKLYLKQLKSFHKEWFLKSFSSQYVFNS